MIIPAFTIDRTQDLVDWYSGFENRPPLYLVHGEKKSQVPLCDRLRQELDAPVSIAGYDQVISIGD